jgi:signal transduction protein with GAF and PtsI domain
MIGRGRSWRKRRERETGVEGSKEGAKERKHPGRSRRGRRMKSRMLAGLRTKTKRICESRAKSVGLHVWASKVTSQRSFGRKRQRRSAAEGQESKEI